MSQYKRMAGRRTGWFLVMLLAMFASVGAIGAYAQSDNGSIVGTITDATGAVIPNATVTVTNVDTGLKLNGKSNPAGEFQIFAVPRGNYKAEVDGAGVPEPDGELCGLGRDDADAAIFAGGGSGEPDGGSDVGGAAGEYDERYDGRGD